MVPQQSIGRHDGLVIKCNLLHDFDIAVLTGADGAKTQATPNPKKYENVQNLVALGLLAALGFALAKYLRD